MYEPRTPSALRNRIFSAENVEFKREPANNSHYRPKRGKKKATDQPISFAIVKPAFGKFVYKGEAGSWQDTMARLHADGHTKYRQGMKGEIRAVKVA